MNRLPTIRQLHFLLSLERHLHFGKAAAKCCVTQSAFSVGFKNLEKTLGVSLAERSGRHVILTPIGLDAAKYAHKFFSEAENMVDAVAMKNKPLTSTLRLGVIPTIAPFILPKALKKSCGVILI